MPTQIQTSSEPKPADVPAKWNQNFSVKDYWTGEMTFFDAAVEVAPVIPLEDLDFKAELPSGRGPYAMHIAWSYEPSEVAGDPELELVRVTLCPAA